MFDTVADGGSAAAADGGGFAVDYLEMNDVRKLSMKLLKVKKMLPIVMRF